MKSQVYACLSCSLAFLKQQVMLDICPKSSYLVCVEAPTLLLPFLNSFVGIVASVTVVVSICCVRNVSKGWLDRISMPPDSTVVGSGMTPTNVGKFSDGLGMMRAHGEWTRLEQKQTNIQIICCKPAIVNMMFCREHKPQEAIFP